MVVLMLMVVRDVRAMAKAIRAGSHGCLRLGGGWWSLNWPLEVLDQTRQHTSLAKVGGDCAHVVLLHDSQHASGVKSLLNN